MGQIDTKFINSKTKNKPKVFVETGTFAGGIPQKMLDDGTFSEWGKVYTIELNNEMCKVASNRYSQYENVGVGKFDRNTNDKDESFDSRKEYFNGKLVLLQGDSSNRLKDVIDEVDEPIAFWLDAHAGAKEGYARGEVDCPLIKELEIIKSHSIKNHFISIDDADLFGQVQYKDGEVVCDYSDITRERVEKLLLEINPMFTIEYVTPFGQLMLVAYEKDVIESESGWWA